MGAGISVEDCSALLLQEQAAKDEFVRTFKKLEASLSKKSSWTHEERSLLAEALKAGEEYYEKLLKRAPAQESGLKEMRAKLMGRFVNIYRVTFKDFVETDQEFQSFLNSANECAAFVGNNAPRQNVKTIVQLYEDGAVQVRADFEKFIKNCPAGEAEMAGLKHLGRVLEKTMLKPDENERKPDQVFDVVRGMIKCENMTDMRKALLYIWLDSSHRWKIVRIKNRFDKGLATSGGWVDCLLNVAQQEDSGFGHICEIQLVYAKMMLIRKGLGGHGDYDKFRTVDELLHATGGGSKTKVSKSNALFELETALQKAKSRPDPALVQVLKSKIREQTRHDEKVARLRAREEFLFSRLVEEQKEQQKIVNDLESEISDVKDALARAEGLSSPKHRQKQTGAVIVKTASGEACPWKHRQEQDGVVMITVSREVFPRSPEPHLVAMPEEGSREVLCCVREPNCVAVRRKVSEEASSCSREPEDVVMMKKVSEERPRSMQVHNSNDEDEDGHGVNEDRDIPIVIDNGSWKIKAGQASEDTPAVVLSPIIGRPKTSSGATGEKESFVGDDAEARRGILDITCPIERGIIKNWDDMEKIWHHLFYSKLRCTPEDRPVVLLTEPPLNSKANRERMIKVLFDKLNSRAVYIAVSSVLSLYSAKLTTGCVVSSGAQVTHIVPVYEGNTIPFAIRRLEIAGDDVTKSLQQMLHKRGYSFETPSELEIVRKMKEKLGSVAQDYERAMAEGSSDDMLYEMPNGQALTLGDEHFRCAEVMFDPTVVGSKEKGLSKTVVESVSACDVVIQEELYESILVDGGGTMLKDFNARLQYELEAKTPKSTKIKIVSSPNRKYATWIGGSILSSSSTFQQMCITVDEYKKAGPSVVHRKCFM